MLVTYLMQYNVQYIIAAVISNGKMKRGISSFKHEKGQSRFDFSQICPLFLWRLSFLK